MPGSYYSDAEIAALPPNSLLKRYASLIYSIASQTSPYGSGTTGFQTFLGECQAWLPTRTLPYFKKTPGDCGGMVATGTRALSLGPIAATPALASGALVATGTIAAAGIGAATLGIGGALLGPLLAILQHHSVAVANEQATLCSVSNEFQAVIPQIDAAIANGSATPAQGVAAIGQMVSQLKAAIDQSIKNETGNSGSNYKGVLDAHVAFAQTYYNDISPLITATAPGRVSTTADASSAAAAAGFTSFLGIGSGSPGTPGASGLSWGSIALIAAVGIAVVLLVRR